MEYEPFGFYMDNYRFGLLISVLANVYRDDKKKHNPFTPDDFLPTSEHKKSRKPRQHKSVTSFLGISKDKLRNMPGVTVIDTPS